MHPKYCWFLSHSLECGWTNVHHTLKDSWVFSQWLPVSHRIWMGLCAQRLVPWWDDFWPELAQALFMLPQPLGVRICGLPDFSGTFCSFVVIHHLWIAYTLSAPAFSSTRHLQWCYSHGRRVAIWMSPWELSTLQTCGKSLCVNRYLLQ